MEMEFKTYDDRDSNEHGVTLFEGGGRIIIYLQRHETIEDIYSTITHECIHWILERYNHVDIDPYKEHDLIFAIQWAEEYLQ